MAGHTYSTTVATPAGPLVTEFMLTDEMVRDGAYSPYASRRAIQSPDDLERVAQVFEHLHVVPTPVGLVATASGLVSEDSPPRAIGASPIHLVQHDLMEMDLFIYLYHDDPDALHQLAARMEPFFESVLAAVLASEVEIFLWGANYDQSVTWPDFFRDEIAPWLRRASDRAHAAGKLLLTHADGENQARLPFYPGCGIDVAESVCTRPMVRNSLAEVRAGFGPGTTVWA